MNCQISIVVLIVFYSSASSANYCLKNLVPLYRLYRPLSDDHFYTTSLKEANNASNSLGFVREGSPELVATSPSDCVCGNAFKPVYRLYKSGAKDDHFYTLSESEAVNAATKLGYKREGIAFYCASSVCTCGATSPLYRYWRHGTDHFYTTDLSEVSKNVVAVGGSYEGITCYIWTARTSATNCRSSLNNLVPLQRLHRPSTKDHFYTTSVTEANNAATNLSYNREGSPGLVATSAEHCQCGQKLKPVYRLYGLYEAGAKDDHFYTLDESEATNAATNLSYKREGIAYYCAAALDECGATLPFYRYWRGTDHFYTTNLTEGNQNVVAVGGKYEGILCYIWAPK